MRSLVILNSTENILNFQGQFIKVVPKVAPIKIKFRVNFTKGCGRVAEK